MLSTKFSEKVYLGFYDSKKILEHPTFEDTFVGGRPIFLEAPQPSQLICHSCEDEPLTSIGQLSSPLDTPRSYNRVLYLLYCERCRRCFRCLKQQAPEDKQIEPIGVEVRTICEESYQIDSSSCQVKELLKIMNRARIEVAEEAVEEMEDQDEDQEEDVPDRPLESRIEEGLINEDDNIEVPQTERVQAPRDQIFEQYRKIMSELDWPVIVYGNIPIPYNSMALNHQHHCKHCGSFLALQLQLTARILTLTKKLLTLDWGNLLVYSCLESCTESIEESVVVQYEVDAVSEEQIEKLLHSQKKKNRKPKKAKNTSPKEEVSLEIVQKQKNEEGDWD